MNVLVWGYSRGGGGWAEKKMRVGRKWEGRRRYDSGCRHWEMDVGGRVGNSFKQKQTEKKSKKVVNA